MTVTYDALERMVEQSKAGTNTEIVYDALGNKLALMSGISLQKAFAPLPAGATAVYSSSGLQYYRHPDWLGSSRFASTSTRTMYNDLAYAPFGEQYAQAGSTGVTDTSFAGNNEDTTTNLYDAQFREYGIQGRWPSPDPAGLLAVNPTNPQSWNRYADVMNNPLAMIDPEGFGPMICRKANNPPCIMTGGGAPPGEYHWTICSSNWR
ncbi:MAG TPA: RHS repeat-associated core domain-containing protein [Candidatus Sulfotelmatobacter sp.]|nr:RHS repeat-associated core domain-containing protein [Candidatus Sulfotelmatobacter sp.]